ncbi:MAG: YfhO family protein, partial [Chloroflexota bacterium]|nr:YfhO family protein [Chloroflexota bacterium]
TAYVAFRAATGAVGVDGRAGLGGAAPVSVAGVTAASAAPTRGQLRRTAGTGVRSLVSLGPRLGLAALVSAIAGGSGAMIAAVQLLPLFELGTFSFRGEGVDYAYASQYSLPPVQLLSLLLPDFFTVNGEYWGLWSRWEIFAYAGLGPLLLAVIGVLLVRHRLVLFFLALGAFALAVTLGEYSPGGIHRLVAGLPGFSVLRAPGRFIFLFTFSISLLGALGADALRRELAPERAGRGVATRLRDTLRQGVVSLVLLVCQLAAMVAPLALALSAVYAETHKAETITWLERHLVRQRGFDPRWSAEQTYQFVLASLDVTQPTTLRQLAILLAVATVFLLWDRLRTLGRVWQLLLVVLIAVDLVGVGQRFHPTTPYSTLAAPSGMTSYLAANPGVYRVFTQKGARDEPNRQLGFTVAEANGYSSLEPDRHQSYVARLEYAPNRLLDLMNVRYRAVKNEFVAAQSFNLTSYDPRRPLLSSTGRNPAGFGAYRLEDRLADRLRIVSTVRWGSSLAQGTPLARLTATDSTGKPYVFEMLAGVHTAEWAWERPDLRGKVPHQIARIARTWQQRDGGGVPYPAHYYFAEFPLSQSVRLRRLEVQFLHPTAQVEIFGIAAYDDATKELEQIEVGGQEKLTRVYADDDMILYENRDYLPRAYLVPSAVVERPGDEILHRLALGDFQPERMVILEEQFDVTRLPPPPALDQVVPIRTNGPQGTEVSSGAGTVRIVRLEDEYISLRATARHNAMLFLADPAYPGWKAYLDGQETQIYRANFLFRAVYVPAGPHTVEFVYRPRSFRLGLLLTLAATVGVVAGLGWLFFARPGGRSLVAAGRRRC